MPKGCPSLPSSYSAACVNDRFVPAVSPGMRAVEQALSAVAANEGPVLILGERGSGKRTLARQIHCLSKRSHEPFTSIICSELTPDFFPKPPVRGNGTGDLQRSFPAGTIFFDEIAELSTVCQARLLQTLFSSERPTRTSSGPRLIAATRRNLEKEIRVGRFREDLYYCLSGVCLRVPPLQYRKQDIPLLVDFFLTRYSSLFNRPKPVLGREVMRFLVGHNWPGNVRELEDSLRTLVAVGDEQVAIAALRSAACHRHNLNRDSELLSLKQAARAASRQAEQGMILRVLARTRWNRKQAAKELQISYKALLYKVKEFGFQDEFTGREEMTS